MAMSSANMNEEDTVSELSEEMELVGPGSMLAEARKEKGLTQKDVAKRLNFRLSLVIDLEAENFDKSLPETFNRGYLRSYAKLVGLSESEVLTSYEVLHVAEKQGAEMLSFSRSTSIEAENNRITWVSYFIFAALIASTVVWWVQDESQSETVSLSSPLSTKFSAIDEVTAETNDTAVSQSSDATTSTLNDSGVNITTPELPGSIETLDGSTSNDEASPVILAAESKTLPTASTAFDIETQNNLEIAVAGNVSRDVVTEIEAPKELITTPEIDVEFTFIGDCWVDIYDANGEHIAWGIKKEGYVMNISATPPIAITLGKPELVAITYEDSAVDMSKYRKGRIARFSVPQVP